MLCNLLLSHKRESCIGASQACASAHTSTFNTYVQQLCSALVFRLQASALMFRTYVPHLCSGCRHQHLCSALMFRTCVQAAGVVGAPHLRVTRAPLKSAGCPLKTPNNPKP